jgi:cleavage stimulation factor subunit 3
LNTLLTLDSFLLNFAYAEAQENANNYLQARLTFQNLIKILQAEFDDEAERRDKNDLNHLAIVQQYSFLSESTITPQKAFAKRRMELSIAWIMYIRFARRSEGLKEMRSVFDTARMDKWIGWQVYEATGINPTD